MRKIVHDVSTGLVDVLEMTPQEEADLLAKQAAHQAAKDAEAAKPTPQKTLLAAAATAKTFDELQAVVLDLIALTFGLNQENGATPVDEEVQP